VLDRGSAIMPATASRQRAYVRGFLVFRGSLLRTINFDENKARRVVGALKNVKARDARFLNAEAGVFKATPA
jgi:hypothetical protein